MAVRPLQCHADCSDCSDCSWGISCRPWVIRLGECWQPDGYVSGSLLYPYQPLTCWVTAAQIEAFDATCSTTGGAPSLQMPSVPSADRSPSPTMSDVSESCECAIIFIVSINIISLYSTWFGHIHYHRFSGHRRHPHSCENTSASPISWT